MLRSQKTAQQIYEELRNDKARKRIGFGEKCCIVNVDLQRGFIDTVNFGGYDNDPNQIPYINRLSQLCRERRLPVIWTQNVHGADVDDYGVRGLRNPDANTVQGIIVDGTPQADIDPRCDLDRAYDFVIKKRMPSAFFETNLQSLLTLRRVDTIIVTGGATSGCVRALAVDGFSRGYRMVIPEECVADAHESWHFASLRDMLHKYADVIPFAEVESHLLGTAGN